MFMLAGFFLAMCERLRKCTKRSAAIDGLLFYLGHLRATPSVRALGVFGHVVFRYHRKSYRLS